jgi:hypothetical protein
MGQYFNPQAFRNLSICLLVVWVTYYGPALAIDGFGKLITFLVLASLLVFVVSYSTDICSAAITFAQSQTTFLFCLVPDRASITPLPSDVVVPTVPNLSPRFQRPPPFLSL